ncbi:MAG: hypothetical protein F4Y35_08690 [Chloroflexi bacterium]|nr:hypothetical protein [Chloroflexota bacterium]
MSYNFRRFWRNRGILAVGESIAAIATLTTSIVAIATGEYILGALGMATTVGLAVVLWHICNNTVFQISRYESEAEAMAAAREDDVVRWWPKSKD